MTEYEFTRDLAAQIIYAEVNHFAAECSPHGPSEAEIQSLTRRLSYVIDKDLNWCDVDMIVGYALELRQLASETHPLLELNGAGTDDNRAVVLRWITEPMFGEIGFLVAGVHTRWELAA